MFKTGHPTYTIAIWKIFRIYKLKVKLFIILTQNGVKTYCFKVENMWKFSSSLDLDFCFWNSVKLL